MLKDIRYIIKKIIIGVAIATIVFLLKTQVFALTFDLVQQESAYMFENFNARITDSNFSTSSTFKRNQIKTINALYSYYNDKDYQYMVIPVQYEVITKDYPTYTGNSNWEYLYYTYTIADFRMTITLFNTDGGGSTCELQNNFLICALEPHKTYNHLTFYYDIPIYAEFNFQVGGYVSLYNSLFTAMIDNVASSNTALNSINQSIQSQTQDMQDNSDANVDVSNMGGITGLLPAGPVDSLLSLPLTLINLLISGTSGTCTPFTFTFVFGEQFTLPCFDTFWNQVPSSLLIFLSDLPAVYIFIQWSKSIYKRVERAVSFESSVDDEWGGV